MRADLSYRKALLGSRGTGLPEAAEGGSMFTSPWLPSGLPGGGRGPNVGSTPTALPTPAREPSPSRALSVMAAGGEARDSR